MKKKTMHPHPQKNPPNNLTLSSSTAKKTAVSPPSSSAPPHLLLPYTQTLHTPAAAVNSHSHPPPPPPSPSYQPPASSSPSSRPHSRSPFSATVPPRLNGHPYRDHHPWARRDGRRRYDHPHRHTALGAGRCGQRCLFLARRSGRRCELWRRGVG